MQDRNILTGKIQAILDNNKNTFLKKSFKLVKDPADQKQSLTNRERSKDKNSKKHL